jgi:hypothetical protein
VRALRLLAKSRRCEHIMARALRLLQLAAMLAAFGMLPAPAATAAAIVTDVRGEARFADGSAVELLREIPSGAQVRLEPSAQIVLIHLGTQATYALSGPGAFVIRPHEVGTPGAGPIAPAKALPAAYQGVRLQVSRIAQASTAMRGSPDEHGIRLLSPVATWLLTRPQALRWERPAQASDREFVVQLTDSENQVVYATRTHATEVALPGTLRLEPGALYGWQVTHIATEGRALESWTEFGMADEAARARAAAARPPRGAADAERIAYALLLEALGLREAARAQWSEAARERPHEARLRALAEGR